MFEPVRGGTRGGQAEFKWSDVSADKDRENYLGHSINAPTGRWQKNKDVHWYSRENPQDEEERLAEIRKIKEVEAEALSAALGFAPSKTGGSTVTAGAATGANAVAVPPSSTSDAQRALDKEEKKRRKAEKKEAKRLKKEQRRAERARSRSASPSRPRDEDDRSHRRHYNDRSRSRSPRRRDGEGPPRSRNSLRNRSRSRTPQRTPPHRAGYDDSERERERERDRRRWDENSRRQVPGNPRWGRT